MAEIRPAQDMPVAARPWAFQVYRVMTMLIPLLILVQALLAGEWLAGHDVIGAHQAIGLLVLALALLQLVMVVVAGIGESVRTVAIIVNAVFFVLVVVQVVLGYAGSDHANQARALHITNGVLLFGLAAYNSTLARRAARGE
jgi:hypothetical protein